MRECVGCSFCCSKAPCGVALRVYGPVTSCPALIYDKEEARWFCKLCQLPGEQGAAYREELSVGAGCCCGLNSWRHNIPTPQDKETQQDLVSDDCRVLLKHLAGEFVSGDTLWLVLRATAADLDERGYDGEAWRRHAMGCMREQRPSKVESFIGAIPED